MNVAVPKLGAVVMMAISLLLARCTGSVPSTATTTWTAAAIRVTAQNQVRVTPTAVTGADGYLWMLGTYPCSTGTCPVLMRSSDGGKSFARVGTPPTGMYGIEFANQEDGYAYGPGDQGDSSRLYWTDDGGRSWRLVFAKFQATVVITGERAYVQVPEKCSTKGLCKVSELASSPVTSDAWTTRRLPLTVTEAEHPFGWTAFGSNVWLILTSGVSKPHLLVSHNAGMTFVQLTPGGYVGGIGCDLTATSRLTLWGFCVTGNGGYAIRSTDGGQDFVSLQSPWGISNGVQIYPASDTEAIFYVLAGDVWLTRDGGKRLNIFLRVPQSQAYDCQVALASAMTWLVLARSGVGPPDLMWLTINGGRSWQPVKVPSVTTTPLDQFDAIVRHGLRVPFEASYRFIPQADSNLRVNFRIWSEPAVGKEREGNFVYEAAFRRGTFRFIQDRSGDYECLRLSPKSAWKCVGPFGPTSIGQSMQVEGYRLPLFIAGQIDAGLAGPLVFFHKAVLGHRLWCLDIQSKGYVCVNKTGQLALIVSLFVSDQLEAVSLALNPSTAVFVPPAKPAPWNKGVLPNLCGAVQCPSNGMA